MDLRQQRPRVVGPERSRRHHAGLRRCLYCESWSRGVEEHGRPPPVLTSRFRLTRLRFFFCVFNTKTCGVRACGFDPERVPLLPVFLGRCSGVHLLGAAAIVTRAPPWAPLSGRTVAVGETLRVPARLLFQEATAAPPRHSCRRSNTSRRSPSSNTKNPSSADVIVKNHVMKKCGVSLLRVLY